MMKRVAAIAAVGLAAAWAGGCASSRSSAVREASRPDAVVDYLTTVRIDLVEGKTDLINDVMGLSEAEAAVFWPIFAEYEDEYFALGDRRRELERELAERTRAGTLDNDAAARLSREFVGMRREMLDLLARYAERIGAELSPVRGAQFLQIESRNATVVDLIVASEMPLISGR